MGSASWGSETYEAYVLPLARSVTTEPIEGRKPALSLVGACLIDFDQGWPVRCVAKTLLRTPPCGLSDPSRDGGIRHAGGMSFCDVRARRQGLSTVKETVAWVLSWSLARRGTDLPGALPRLADRLGGRDAVEGERYGETPARHDRAYQPSPTVRPGSNRPCCSVPADVAQWAEGQRRSTRVPS